MDTQTSRRLGLDAAAPAPWLAAVAAGLLLLFPRTSPAAVALLVLSGVAIMPRPVALASIRSVLSAPIAVALALAAWSLLSTLWAADPPEAFSKSSLLITLVGAVAVGAAAMRSVGERLDRRVGLAVLCVLAGGLTYLLFEEATRHALKRSFYALLPFLKPVAKHTAGGDTPDDPLMLSSYISNRNLAALALLLWPAVLLAGRLMPPGRRALAIGALVAGTGLAAVLSAHETSIIAIGLSIAVFLLARLALPVALALVTASWLAATLLVVPIASHAFNVEKLHMASWLPNSARHRLVLWAYTAEQVWQRPLTGVGAASTKLIDARRAGTYEKVPGTRYEWRTTPHPHNIYLQTWYELGLVGAALLALLGLAIARGIRSMEKHVAPHALATFVAAAVVGAFSWGLWQAWFLGLFAASALLLVLSSRVSRGERKASQVPATAPSSAAAHGSALAATKDR